MNYLWQNVSGYVCLPEVFWWIYYYGWMACIDQWKKLGGHPATLLQHIKDIPTIIWVNYNDLTATEPWNHG